MVQIFYSMIKKGKITLDYVKDHCPKWEKQVEELLNKDIKDV